MRARQVFPLTALFQRTICSLTLKVLFGVKSRQVYVKSDFSFMQTDKE